MRCYVTTVFSIIYRWQIARAHFKEQTMRRAYSFPKRRTLSAELISYDDCIDDRIVCEVCGNRVYKCVLGDGEEAVHYMSHYKAESLIAAQCEERVAARISGARGDDIGTPRGQILRHRVEALGRILDAEDPTRAIFAKDIERTCSPEGDGPSLMGILKRRSTEAFRRLAVIEGALTDMPLPFDRLSTHELPSLTSRLENTLPRPSREQAVWATDLTGLLIMTQSIRALDKLFAHAAASLAHATGPVSDAAPVVAAIILGASSGLRLPDHIGQEVAAMVVEMRRLLAVIDHSAPVPRAQTSEAATDTRTRNRIRRRHSRRGNGMRNLPTNTKNRGSRP